MANYVAGIDIGTTGAKTMILDLKGNVLGKAYREYPLRHEHLDWCEIDADYLIEQVFDTVKEAVETSGVNNQDIKAISFSVQRATFCMLDENLEPINNNFYVWLDNRAAGRRTSWPRSTPTARPTFSRPAHLLHQHRGNGMGSKSTTPRPTKRPNTSRWWTLTPCTSSAATRSWPRSPTRWWAA